MAAAAPHIGALPASALQHILLTATTHDNLLRFVAACARVCGEWWRVVGGSAAYGRGLGAGEDRARVLREITRALEKEDETLRLAYKSIGDAGAAALGAALQALPTIRFTRLYLNSNQLTAAGVSSLAPALRRSWGAGGLRELRLGYNPLGDAGVAALAKALPPSLETLSVTATGCGDDGLVALAAALTGLTRLAHLRCRRNPAAGARGWVALAGALPSLPALEELDASDCSPVQSLAATAVMDASGCTGMGSEGAAALAAAVPQCPALRYLYVGECGLDEQAVAALQAAAASVARSWERPNGLSLVVG